MAFSPSKFLGLVGLMCFIVLSPFSAFAQPPRNSAGMRITVTRDGLNKIANLTKQFATQDISFYPLGGKHVKAYIPAKFNPSGKPVLFEASHISFDQVYWGDPKFTFHQKRTLQFEITNLTAHVFAKWHYKTNVFGFELSDHGILTADLKGANVIIAIRFGMSPDGRLQIYLDSNRCKISGESIKLELNGAESWLYNAFDDAISKVLRDQLTPMLCRSIKEGTHRFNNKKYKFDQRIKAHPDERITLNVQLPRPPVFVTRNGQQYIDGFINGMFSVRDRHPPRLRHTTIPTEFRLPALTPRMVYVWVSDEAQNSLLKAIQPRNGFRFRLHVHGGPADSSLFNCVDGTMVVNYNKIPNPSKELVDTNDIQFSAKDFMVENTRTGAKLTGTLVGHFWEHAEPSKIQLALSGEVAMSDGEQFEPYFKAKRYRVLRVTGPNRKEIKEAIAYDPKHDFMNCLNHVLQKDLFQKSPVINPFQVENAKIYHREGHVMLEADVGLVSNY